MREVDQMLQNRALAAVRKSMPAHAWDRCADAIVSDRRKIQLHLRKPDDAIDRTLFGELDRFRASGIMQLPTPLATDRVGEVRRHLESQPVHNGPHVLRYEGCVQRPLGEMRQETQLAGYSTDQLLRTPRLIDILNRPDLVDFVELYLDCVPTLYSINAWWSFPAKTPEMLDVQYFHRDTDDWRFCTLFIYLTDVDLLGGPHQVIAGSQSVAGLQDLLERARALDRDAGSFDVNGSFVNFFSADFSQHCERLFHEAIVNIVGAAGTMFLVNTTALHRGLLPVESPRLMIWARFGLGPNTNSANLEQGPLNRRQVTTDLQDTPRNRYVNRLLFEFDRGHQAF